MNTMEIRTEHFAQANGRMPWEHSDDPEQQRQIEAAREFGHQFDVDALQPELMAEASRLQHEAHSHRDFHVGVAVLAFNSEGQYEIFPGWNYKEKPGTDPKRQCAEEMALQKAWNAGFRYIRAITIAGEPQDDDTSGAHHDTLHPCTTCRGHLGTLLEL